MTPTKQHKAVIIEKCLIMASNHFKVDPVAVFREAQIKCRRKQLARAAVWWHLKECGMSEVDIGRMWLKKAAECVRGRTGIKRVFEFTEGDWKMVKSMPKIETALEIARV
jgi:hypothetical protein